MDDLASTLSQLLANPEAMNQLKSAAAALGLGDMADGQMNNQSQMHTSSQNHPPQNGNSSQRNPQFQGNPGQNPGFMGNSQGNPGFGGGFSGSGMGGNNQGGMAAPSPLGQTADSSGGNGGNPFGNLDLSALGNVLGSLGLGQNSQPGSQPNMGQNTGLPSIDMGTLLKIQGALSRLSQTDKNVDLLMALKPHLSAEKAKKVDDAVKIMQLIKLLPLIKESGLFGGGNP